MKSMKEGGWWRVSYIILGESCKMERKKVHGGWTYIEREKKG